MALLGEGTETDPYLIGTPEDLDEIRTKSLSSHFRQMKDIDMSTWGDFDTISDSYSNAFSGVYDGSGYKIENLSIKEGPQYNGLFGYVRGDADSRAVIKNIKLVNPYFQDISSGSSSMRFGFIAGWSLSNSDIENIEVVGGEINVSKYGAVGGVIGHNQGQSSENPNNSIHILVKGLKISAIGTTSVGGIFGHARRVRLYNGISILKDSTNASSVFGYIDRNVYIYNAGGFPMPTTGSGTAETGTPKVLTEPKSLSTYLTDSGGQWNTNLDNTPNWYFSPNGICNMVEGEYPYITGSGSIEKPIEISNEDDLNNLKMPGNHTVFKLTNDIHISESFSGIYFIDKDLAGTLDGDGYSIKNITIENEASGSTTHYSFFKDISGTLKNLKLEYNYVLRDIGPANNSMYSALIVESLYGTLSNISVTVNGDNINGNNNRGAVGVFRPDSRMENCSVYHMGELRARTGNTGYHVYILGTLASDSNITIKNNIFKINSLFGYDGRVSNTVYYNTIENNVYFLESLSSVYGITGFTQLSSLEELRDPNNSAYDSFDKDKWVFRDDEDPIQSVFVKITEKIEERLISLYSKGMYLESRWTKGFKNILNFFTNKSGSSTRTKRSPFRRLLSFTKDISLKMLFKKRGRKRVKSNSGLVVSNITKLKKLTETILSYSNKITSNYSKIKSGTKVLEIYSDKVSFRTTEIKRSLKKAVNYSKGIHDNLLRKITRRHNRKTQSFSGNISSDVFRSYLTRVTERVMSYSGHMRSIIRRASNKYDFEFRMVSNQANKITIRFKRFIRTMRTTKSHSGMMTTFIRRLSKISAPTEIFARTIARTNSIKMRVKESFTKIRASNGGGD